MPVWRLWSLLCGDGTRAILLHDGTCVEDTRNMGQRATRALLRLPTICTKVLFISSHAYSLGFRPTIQNHPVWRTLSRHTVSHLSSSVKPSSFKENVKTKKLGTLRNAKLLIRSIASSHRDRCGHPEDCLKRTA